MTAPSVTSLVRRFKIGATLLNDPAPELPPEEAIRLYIPNYPFLATATLGEPELHGDCLIYPAQKPEIQTKGASGRPQGTAAGCSPEKLQQALDELSAWCQTSTSSVKATKAWGDALYQITRKAASRERTPVRDALMIPLA